MTPGVVLLVDRPAIADALRRSPDLDPDVAVVAVDGTPTELVAALVHAFREGASASVLYLHDAATVLYPFTIEPIASLDAPDAFVDLGLPPFGAPPRRFGDATLPDPVVTLSAIPIAALVRHCNDGREQLRLATDRRTGT